mmetsp:Transcript_40972/g.96194  ORF Transcript_40972/g.96194 Transcript_40972/m.96194 type:complete len:266 (+) Transcript_40972:1080-1877(+)
MPARISPEQHHPSIRCEGYDLHLWKMLCHVPVRRGGQGQTHDRAISPQLRPRGVHGRRHDRHGEGSNVQSRPVHDVDRRVVMAGGREGGRDVDGRGQVHLPREAEGADFPTPHQDKGAGTVLVPETERGGEDGGAQANFVFEVPVIVHAVPNLYPTVRNVGIPGFYDQGHQISWDIPRQGGDRVRHRNIPQRKLSMFEPVGFDGDNFGRHHRGGAAYLFLLRAIAIESFRSFHCLLLLLLHPPPPSVLRVDVKDVVRRLGILHHA